MKLLIWGYQMNDEIHESVLDLIQTLESGKHSVCVMDEFAKNLGISESVSTINAEDIPNDIELLISIGGDGTLLSAAHAVMVRPIPILGVNLGSLGFLTGLERQWKRGLKDILSGRYHVEARMVLSCRIRHQDGTEEKFWALNDIVIERRDNFSMLPIRVDIDKDYLNTYLSDGLIVSTPTGSTAYSLSAGGPIMDPTLAAMIITPISPHTLSVRPIVIPEFKQIYVQLPDLDSGGRIHIDGREEREILSSDRILIQTSSYKIQLVSWSGATFYKKLRTKLHWGSRNS